MLRRIVRIELFVVRINQTWDHYIQGGKKRIVYFENYLQIRIDY